MMIQEVNVIPSMSTPLWLCIETSPGFDKLWTYKS